MIDGGAVEIGKLERIVLLPIDNGADMYRVLIY